MLKSVPINSLCPEYGEFDAPNKEKAVSLAHAFDDPKIEIAIDLYLALEDQNRETDRTLGILIIIFPVVVLALCFALIIGVINRVRRFFTYRF